MVNCIQPLRETGCKSMNTIQLKTKSLWDAVHARNLSNTAQLKKLCIEERGKNYLQIQRPVIRMLTWGCFCQTQQYQVLELSMYLLFQEKKMVYLLIFVEQIIAKSSFQGFFVQLTLRLALYAVWMKIKLWLHPHRLNKGKKNLQWGIFFLTIVNHLSINLTD